MFSANFWSTNYATGLQTIFDKLFQGCSENSEVLAMVTDRITLETTYATGLQAFPSKQGPTKDGFNRDEGATLRQAYVQFLDEIQGQGLIHAEIAEKLDRGVRGPFLTWSNSHKKRVYDAHDKLMKRIKELNKKEARVLKAQQTYFSKCRQLEDRDHTTEDGDTSTSSWTSHIINTHKKERHEEKESVTLAGREYLPEQVSNLLQQMLREISYGDYKVPILGTYENVSTGDEIVLWARKRLDHCKNVGQAEKFGQGLIDNGFLKAVGRMNSKFVNSMSYGYQWTDRALDYDPMALFPEPELPTSPVKNVGMNEYFGFLKQNIEPTTKEISKIHQEIAESDEKYRGEVLELDLLRCALEEMIVETLKFMEQCEIDRLKAIKTVFGDFAHAVAAPLPKLGPVVQRLGQHQHSVNPLSDLSYLVENYKTSYLSPRVITYESFHSAAKCQTFGVDLASAPFMVPTLLTYLSSQDQVPVTAQHFIEQAPLASVHQLRNQINSGMAFEPLGILPSFPVHVVVSTLKQFLLELQDSLVSFTMYDMIKSIYKESKIGGSALISALSQLPKLNLTTLEQIIGFVAPMCEDEDTQTRMSQALSRYILRPRTITHQNMADKHPGFMINDLIDNKDEIFAQVYNKKSKLQRERSVSTSEANRRANVEQRNREMVEKSVSARAARSRTGSPPTPDPNASTTSITSVTSNGSSNGHGHSSSVISSSGLLPLTLSPSREPPSSPNIKRISSSSLTATSPPYQRHQKSYSTPIKSPIMVATSPNQADVVTRERGRSFREVDRKPSPIPDEKEPDDEEEKEEDGVVQRADIPTIMATPPQQFTTQMEVETPKDQIIPSPNSGSVSSESETTSQTDDTEASSY